MVDATAEVVLVTHYWPPLVGAAVNRMVAWAEALERRGVRVAVVTPPPDPADPFYGGAEPPARIAVHHVAFPDPRRWLLRRSAKPSAARVPRAGGSGRLRRGALLVRDLLELPDYRRLWNRRAAAVVRRLAPRVLVTTSPYGSTHLVGLAWRRRTRGVWIADFRDVWTQHWGRRRHTPLHRRYNLHLLRRILTTADLVTTFHAYGLERLAVEAGLSPTELEAKGLVVYNGVAESFVAALADRPWRPPTERLRLLYTGTFWTWSMPPGFVEAWRTLAAAASDPPELVLVGRVEPEVATVLEGLGARIEPPRPPMELPELLRSTTFLVVFSGPDRVSVSSKLFEYMAAEQPILYFGDPVSAGAELLRARGAPKAIPAAYDPAGVAELLRRATAAADAGVWDGFVPRFTPAFLRERQADRVAERIVAALEGGTPMGSAGGSV